MNIIKVQLKKFEVELLILSIKQYLKDNIKNITDLDKTRLELLLERLELYLDDCIFKANDDVFEV